MQLYSFVLVSIVFIRSACHAANRAKNYHLHSFDVDCNFNTKWIKDGMCNITRNANGTGTLSAAAFVIRPADGIYCRVQSHVLNDNKKYIPGLLGSTIDICALGNGQENFWLQRFFPRVVILLKDVIRQCPYEGQLRLTDFPIDGSMLTKFLPAGTFRLDGRLYNARNDTLVYIKSYAVIRK